MTLIQASVAEEESLESFVRRMSASSATTRSALIRRSKSYCFVLQLKDGVDYFIKVRLTNSGHLHAPDPRVTLKKEGHFLEMMASVLPVPRVYAHLSSSDQTIRDAIAMEYIRGCTAKSFMKRASIAVQEAIVNRFGDLMKSIHSMKYTGFGLIGDNGKILESGTDYHDYILQRLLSKQQFLEKAKLPVARACDSILSYDVAHWLKNVSDFRVLHCDLTLGGSNYLLKFNGKAPEIAGVFDFEWARAGHPYEELAKVCVNMPSYLWDEFFRSYGCEPEPEVFGFYLKLETLVKASWLARHSLERACEILRTGVRRKVNRHVCSWNDGGLRT
jgi:aminoglycoside phosphotransferase (APT) family kinase protein